MKLKINILVGFSIVMLLLLSAMQYYLVRTTYDHKVEQFRAEVKQRISKATNNFSDLDSTIFLKKDMLYRQLAEDYVQDKRVRNAVKQAMTQNAFKEELTQQLKKRFAEEMPDLQIDFALVLDKFVIFEGNKEADTIYSEKPDIRNTVMGNLASLDGSFPVRNYVGTSSGKNNFRTITEDSLYVSVAGTERIILQRMALILAFAVISIAVLITLFAVALRSLIRQKKISDIKTDFINNITHELQTPLTTLSVSVKVLQKEATRNNEKAFANVLQTVDRQNTRIQNLIEQVMSNSLGHSDITLKKEQIVAAPFLSGIISDFCLANPDILIETHFTGHAVHLELDRFHVTSAIVNVLENAVKYGSTAISVTTSVTNGALQISITDNGIGIGKQQQSLLFDKFYRVNEGDRHSVKGLGLGLYYASQILKAHHGAISVWSQEGKGAQFTLTFPALS